MCIIQKFDITKIDFYTKQYKCFLGQQPGEYKDFIFEPHVQQYQNGSIHFSHISKENEGQYLCEAKNNIGTGVSKVIFLKVNGKHHNESLWQNITQLISAAPAYFAQKSKQVQVVKGDPAHLQCSALGDTPMEINWKVGGQQISKNSDQR